MAITFDRNKSAANALSRGLPFDLVERLDWTTALIEVDDRRDYGEHRLRVFGAIDGRLHVAIVTPREGDLRVISLREANRKEVRLYGQEVGRSSRTPG